jgi:hypothetical protein
MADHPVSAAFGRCAVLMLTCGVALAFDGPREAAAHSWYPSYCCSDQDCMKVDRIEYVAGGMYMIVGELRVFVPQSMEKRPSHDNDAHICILRTQSGRYRVRCVFMPGTA